VSQGTNYDPVIAVVVVRIALPIFFPMNYDPVVVVRDKFFLKIFKTPNKTLRGVHFLFLLVLLF
jgi:hypothetical protein